MKILETLEESKLYKIIGDNTFKKTSKELAQNLHIQIINIMNFFKIWKINQIKIFLYDNEKDFQNVTKYPYKLKALAGAYSQYAIIIYCDLNKVDVDELNHAIMHEIVHTIYNYYFLEHNKKTKIAWLDEGLAQNLSKEKEYLKNNKKLKDYIMKNIFNNDTIIPEINYLSKHGNKYGDFIDEETNKYNGYVWSYLIVRYLIETKTKDELNEIIRNQNNIKILEKTLIQDTLNYYKKRLEVDSYDQVDERTNRRNI